MKALLWAISIVATWGIVIGFGTDSVSAQRAENVETDLTYDYDVTQPWNIYSGSSATDCSTFSVKIVLTCSFGASVSNIANDQDLEIQLQEIDHNGNYVRTVAIWNIDGAACNANPPPSSECSFDYFFHGNEDFPFQIRDVTNGWTLSKHYVTPHPSAAWFDTARDHHEVIDEVDVLPIAVAPGYVPYGDNDDPTEPMWDPQNYQFAEIEEDGFIILHYLGTIKDENGFDNPRTINILDASGNRVLALNTRDDLLAFQNGEEGNHDRATQPQRVNNFIVVSVDSVLPAFLDDRLYNEITWTIGNPGKANLNPGVWQTSTSSTAGTCCVANGALFGSYGEGPIIVTSNAPEWDIDAARDRITEGNNTTVTVTRRTEVSNTDPFYRCQFLNDDIVGPLPDDYCDEIEPWESPKVTYTHLKPNSSGVLLIMYPNSDWPGTGAPADFYEIQLRDDWEVIPIPEIDTTLNDLLESLGMDTTFGGFIFATIILIATALMLTQLGATMPIIAMAMIGMMAALSVIGILPIWIVLLIGVFGILAVAGRFGLFGGGDDA